MPRFTGRFVTKDIANDKQYLADLLFGWDVGDDLTGWTTGGNTVPTIAANGKIDLYEASAGGGIWKSWLYRTIPNTMGKMNYVLEFDVTMMADDFGSFLELIVAGSTAPNLGTWYFWQPSIMYYTSSGCSTQRNLAFNFVVGTEYRFAIIFSQEGFTLLINGVRQGFIPASEIGVGGNLSATQLKELFAGNKTIQFYTEHLNLERSHWQIRNVKFGRLVGVGDI
jgi:hypothetical protein